MPEYDIAAKFCLWVVLDRLYRISGFSGLLLRVSNYDPLLKSFFNFSQKFGTFCKKFLYGSVVLFNIHNVSKFFPNYYFRFGATPPTRVALHNKELGKAMANFL